MPKKKKSKQTPADELVAMLLKDQTPQEALAGLAALVTNAALRAEMREHLGYDEGATPGAEQRNRRNGKRTKKVRSELGELKIEVPRDREGSFEPQLIKRYERAIPGFSDRLLALYARGMSTREIQAFFSEQYGVGVSRELVSRVTDTVVEEVSAWRNRPLQSLYPIIYIDALVLKVREDGVVGKKSLYLAIGVDEEGEREVLGMWLAQTEGAKFWLSILTELKNRGVEDVLFLCADGLTGLPDAVEAVFPKAIFQTCIVHLIRASTQVVPWKDKREVCKELKKIYTAATVESAKKALDTFEAQWGERYPVVVDAWRRRFDEWSPFLDFPQEIRRAIYTTNVIEATNRQIRKVLKTKGALPSDDAVYKLVYLVLRSRQDAWKKSRRSKNWAQVRLQLNVLFKDRFPIEV